MIYSGLLAGVLGTHIHHCMDVEDNPNEQEGYRHFERYVNVLDGAFHIYAGEETGKNWLRYAAKIAAELLDQNGDGKVDDPKIEEKLRQYHAHIGRVKSRSVRFASNFFFRPQYGAVQFFFSCRCGTKE